MFYSGVVSVITGDFKFILIDKDTIIINCYVYSEYLKEIVKLLEVGEFIKVKGEVQSYNVDYFKQKIVVDINVNEIIG